MSSNPKIIGFFNNKGGVSKTTTCFNLGWGLAEKGNTVIMVDTDPQCNLTGMALEVDKGDLLPEDYRRLAESNLYDALKPALKSLGTKITTPTCKTVGNKDNLYLMAGSVKLSEVETQLATSMTMGSIFPAAQNVPGSFSKIYDLIGEKYNADYILLDMSPSLGALNQVNFLNSDYFIVPMAPDIFSVMAIQSLSEVIPAWAEWADRINKLDLFNDNDLIYPFEPRVPKFLGTVVQKYNLRKGLPSHSFSSYFDYLDSATNDIFAPALNEAGLLLDQQVYEDNADGHNIYRITQIPNFNSLIARAQETRKPVFTLEAQDLNTTGAPQQNQLDKIQDFREIFDNFSEKIIRMTA